VISSLIILPLIMFYDVVLTNNLSKNAIEPF
jgi:hypothetical protein